MRDRIIETREIDGHTYEMLAQRLFSYRRGNLNERIVCKVDGKIISRDVYKRAIGEMVRETELGTCQVCERAIGVKAGVIAHHGYRRPGSGYQTTSCFGARHLDFEHARDRLGEWIKVLERQAQDNEDAVTTMRSSPYRITRRPATYDHRKGVHLETLWWEVDDPGYPAAQRIWLERHEREARELRTEALRQQARYDGWGVRHALGNPPDGADDAENFR